MNILGHITTGVIGSLITGDISFLIGSVIPDIVLLPNEIKNIIKGKTFDKNDVIGKKLYDITHSLLILPASYLINPLFFMGHLIHIFMDIPFHSGSFRWKPFIVDFRKPIKKKALLLSGGMDSIACSFMEKDADLIYINYGQDYHDLEYPHAQQRADELGLPLTVLEYNWGHDIENRNYYMIAELKKMGYEEVITGSRNLFPFTDKYGDSNWVNLKLYQYLMGVYVNMPLTGLLKFQIKYKLRGYTNYYSTEDYVKS